MVRQQRTYLSEWQESWLQYWSDEVGDEGRRMLRPLVERIYGLLVKEAPTVDVLTDLYFHHGDSMLKRALGVMVSDLDMLHSSAVGFVERVAYCKRYRELADLPEAPLFRKAVGGGIRIVRK